MAPQKLMRRGGQLLFLILVLKETFLSLSGGLLFNDQIGSLHLGEASFLVSDKRGRICDHTRTIISNSTAVEEALKRADYFHNRGGGLDMLTKYQDDNVRSTMTKYELAIHPYGKDGQADPNRTLYGKQSYEYMQSYMKNSKDPRGGYFTSLPGGDYANGDQFQANRHHLHFRDRKVHAEEPVLNKRWLTGMGPIGPKCDNLYKFGEEHEAKYFCLDHQPAPGAKVTSSGDSESERSSCHLLSLGSNDEWGFEEEAIKIMPHCHTHTFDCTLADKMPKNKPNSSRVHFYPYCVSSHSYTDNFGREYLTYAEIWNKTGATTAPKFAKIDVEGFEFEIFPQMMEDAAAGRTVLPEQIEVELHFMTRMWAVSWNLRSITAAEIMLLIGIMFRQGGYVPAYNFYMKGCIPCLEVLFVRVQC